MEGTKYIVLLGDGMADEPIDELGGKTPLEFADTPNMDFIARHGTSGMISTVPEGKDPGSDIANLSILGYDPKVYYTGRAPIEAASMGVDLGDSDIAFRMNLVTISDGTGGKRRMVDYSSGHIPSSESHRLIDFLKRELVRGEFRIYPGKDYRHLFVWEGGKEGIVTTPPHDIMGKEIGLFLPHGEGSGYILSLIKRSWELLFDHPINKNRKRLGESPANSIWLWGQGKRPALPSFSDRFGIGGAVISAVDLIKGLGVLTGLDVIEVDGATGWIDTNYAGKVKAALDALDGGADFVYLHIEGPDEAGHSGVVEYKIEGIERFDKEVVGPIFEGMKKYRKSKVLVLTDHPTPLNIRTHTSDPVPFSIFGLGREGNGARDFCEASAKKTGLFVGEGHTFMERFLKGGF